MQEILSLCVTIDCVARDTYRHVSHQLESRPEWAELAPFWAQLAEEEADHVRFWSRLEDLAIEGKVPVLFENPDVVKEQLKDIADRALALSADAATLTDTSQVFLVTYWLEFYLLHPALSTLLHYGRLLEGFEDPQDWYGQHILSVVEVLEERATNTPELQMLAQVLAESWRRNLTVTAETTMDGLTGALSRDGFERMAKLLAFVAHRNHTPIGVAVLDVDDFRKINEAQGRGFGDQVLRDVARIARESTRRSDALGRYGGDEFVILLSGADERDTREIAEKIRSSVEHYAWPAGAITVSLGTAAGHLRREPEEDFWELLRQADDRLYHAKREGRNRVA